MSNPYSAYKKQSVTTMTPVEVVIKLYSETERQLAIGVNAIRTKEIKKAHESLMKAQELLGALRGSLDMDVPVSKRQTSGRTRKPPPRLKRSFRWSVNCGTLSPR